MPPIPNRHQRHQLTTSSLTQGVSLQQLVLGEEGPHLLSIVCIRMVVLGNFSSRQRGDVATGVVPGLEHLVYGGQLPQPSLQLLCLHLLIGNQLLQS